MTYITLQYGSVEQSLADWGISTWRREANNQASDSFGFNLLTATDAAEIFPFGAMITLRLGRSPSSPPTPNPNRNLTLPQSGVTSWTGGTIWFVGYRAQNIRVGSAQMEGFAYKFAGPWDFFFERLVFQKLWLTWNGVKQIADWRSQVVLGESVNSLTGAGDTVTGTTTTNLMSIAQQCKEIAAYVAAQSSYEQTVNGLGWPAGAQVQFDPLTTDSNGNYHLLPAPGPNCRIPDFVPGYAGAVGDTSIDTSGVTLRAPLDAVNDMTCAECLRRELRWIGGLGSPVVWFDYTTAPPTLHLSTRDQLPAVTLPMTGDTAALKIQRRDDLIPPAVAFKYRINGEIDSQPYSLIENDVAATVDGSAVEGIGPFGLLKNLAGGAISSDAQTQLPLQARRFGAQIGTFDFQGFSSNAATATLQSAALNLADPAGAGPSAAFWTALFPDLADVTGLSFYNSGNPGATVLDHAGTVINTETFANVLLDGQVAPWMYTGNDPGDGSPGQTVEGTIRAYFTYSESATPPSGDTAVSVATVPFHERTIKVRLTNLASGSYTSTAQTVAGEPVPYGLAGYIYGIETIPQYQGTLTVQEDMVTDVCPLGNALNLSGGLAEWAAMNACVQQIIYDDRGRTTLIFGPAQHLGNADLVERLRVNRGPRWYNLIGGDLLNTGAASSTTELGQNLPKHSPSPGNKVASLQIFPTNLTDMQAHNYATAAPPGVTIYGPSATSQFALLGGGPGIALI
jgi:hypothetical protein